MTESNTTERTVGQEPTRPVDESPVEEVKSLFAQLTGDASQWLRQETRLAKQELSEKASEATHNLVKLASGGVILASGLIVLLFAIAEGIAAAFVAAEFSPVVARLFGMLIVGILVSAGGAVMCNRAKDQLTMKELKPERTSKTLRNAKHWAESKVK